MALHDTPDAPGERPPPRLARPDEVAAVARAATAQFPGARDMRRQYPLMFDAPEARHWIVERAGEVLAHAGCWLGQACVHERAVRVACLGAIFTVPGARERGLASAVVAAAVTGARAEGAQLGLISGRRSLYQRQGFEAVSPTAFFLAADHAPTTLTVHEADRDDAGSLAALYEAEPCRFRRPPADWERLLAAGTVFYGPGRILLVLDAGRPVAYAAFQQDPVELREAGPVHRAIELAGDRARLAAAVPALRAHLGAQHPLGLLALPEDGPLAGEALRRGWGRAEVQLAISAARWDPTLAGAPLPFYGLNYL